MRTTYQTKPHKHNAEFPHDGGWAIIVTGDGPPKQTGWFRDRERAEQRVKEASETQQAISADSDQSPNASEPQVLAGPGIDSAA